MTMTRGNWKACFAGQKVMILAQTQIVAGSHNLLGLRVSATIRACAKRVVLDLKRSFTISSRKSFTLLEITLALTILVLIASFTSVHIKRLIDTHRFEAQVSDLFTSLQEAQVLSAAYQTDFALEIKKEKGRFFYQFTTDEPLSERKFSKEKKVLFPGAQVKFKEKETTHLHLDIYSGGRIEPQGVLSFLQSKEEKARALYIDLQYGNLIKFCYIKPQIMKPQTNLQPIKI